MKSCSCIYQGNSKLPDPKILLSRKRFYIPDLVDGDKINVSNDYSLTVTAVSITVLDIKRWTYLGNKLPNFSFNILMMNCFIKCITFSAPHIVKPQWRIMNAFFISFCFQATVWNHTSIGRLKMNTRSS